MHIHADHKKCDHCGNKCGHNHYIKQHKTEHHYQAISHCSRLRGVVQVLVGVVEEYPEVPQD